MNTRNQCSPETLETTTYPAHKGANSYKSAKKISITSGSYHRLFSSLLPETTDTLSKGKTRIPTATWEVRRELCRRGMIAIPVRGGSPVMIDLVAWDERIIYGIAVRRGRGDPNIRDITARYNPLIRELRSIQVPATVEIQLWISINQSFQVYRVLAGGLMSRSLP